MEITYLLRIRLQEKSNIARPCGKDESFVSTGKMSLSSQEYNQQIPCGSQNHIYFDWLKTFEQVVWGGKGQKKAISKAV